MTELVVEVGELVVEVAANHDRTIATRGRLWGFGESLDFCSKISNQEALAFSGRARCPLSLLYIIYIEYIRKRAGPALKRVI